MTSLWVSQTPATSAGIPILLLPVGGIAPADFRRFARLCDSLSKLRKDGLSRPGDWKASSCPLDAFSWLSGAVRFRFVDVNNNAGGLSPWGDFQEHRQVHGAIGVLHAGSGGDWAAAERELHKHTATYPNATIRRLFVLGSSFDEAAASERAQLSRADECVEFPPDHAIGESSAVHAHAEFTLGDIAVTYVTLFLGKIREMQSFLDGGSVDKIPAWLKLDTPLDQEEEKDRSRRKKRLVARARKRAGDMALLVGSYEDAALLYRRALSESRAIGDALWVGGAQEGLGSAYELWWHTLKEERRDTEELERYLKQDIFAITANTAPFFVRGAAEKGPNPNPFFGPSDPGDPRPSGYAIAQPAAPGDVDELVPQMVVLKSWEALLQYRRNALSAQLEVEAAFRLAKYFVQAFRPPSPDDPPPAPQEALLTSAAARQEALRVVEAAMRVDLRGLGQQSRIERSLEAAAVARDLRLPHRVNTFLLLASQECVDLHNLTAAHRFAQLVAYGLGLTVHADRPVLPPSSTYADSSEPPSPSAAPPVASLQGHRSISAPPTLGLGEAREPVPVEGGIKRENSVPFEGVAKRRMSLMHAADSRGGGIWKARPPPRPLAGAVQEAAEALGNNADLRLAPGDNLVCFSPSGSPKLEDLKEHFGATSQVQKWLGGGPSPEIFEEMPKSPPPRTTSASDPPPPTSPSLAPTVSQNPNAHSLPAPLLLALAQYLTPRRELADLERNLVAQAGSIGGAEELLHLLRGGPKTALGWGALRLKTLTRLLRLSRDLGHREATLGYHAAILRLVGAAEALFDADPAHRVRPGTNDFAAFVMRALEERETPVPPPPPPASSGSPPTPAAMPTPNSTRPGPPPSVTSEPSDTDTPTPVPHSADGPRRRPIRAHSPSMNLVGKRSMRMLLQTSTSIRRTSPRARSGDLDAGSFFASVAKGGSDTVADVPPAPPPMPVRGRPKPPKTLSVCCRLTPDAQAALLTGLRHTTALLPPESRLDLSGVLLVHSARPLETQCKTRIIPHPLPALRQKVEAGEDKMVENPSFFFFKTKGEGGKGAAKWVAGEPQLVVVVLENPLRVDVEVVIEDLHFVRAAPASDAAPASAPSIVLPFVVEPRKEVLPPKSRHRPVAVRVQPQGGVGVFEIAAVVLRVAGARCVLPRSHWGPAPLLQAMSGPAGYDTKTRRLATLPPAKAEAFACGDRCGCDLDAFCEDLGVAPPTSVALSLLPPMPQLHLRGFGLGLGAEGMPPPSKGGCVELMVLLGQTATFRIDLEQEGGSGWGEGIVMAKLEVERPVHKHTEGGPHLQTDVTDWVALSPTSTPGRPVALTLKKRRRPLPPNASAAAITAAAAADASEAAMEVHLTPPPSARAPGSAPVMVTLVVRDVKIVTAVLCFSYGDLDGRFLRELRVRFRCHVRVGLSVVDTEVVTLPTESGLPRSIINIAESGNGLAQEVVHCAFGRAAHLFDPDTAMETFPSPGEDLAVVLAGRKAPRRSTRESVMMRRRISKNPFTPGVADPVRMTFFPDEDSDEDEVARWSFGSFLGPTSEPSSPQMLSPQSSRSLSTSAPAGPRLLDSDLSSSLVAISIRNDSAFIGELRPPGSDGRVVRIAPSAVTTFHLAVDRLPMADPKATPEDKAKALVQQIISLPWRTMPSGLSTTVEDEQTLGLHSSSAAGSGPSVRFPPPEGSLGFAVPFALEPEDRDRLGEPPVTIVVEGEATAAILAPHAVAFKVTPQPHGSHLDLKLSVFAHPAPSTNSEEGPEGLALHPFCGSPTSGPNRGPEAMWDAPEVSAFLRKPPVGNRRKLLRPVGDQQAPPRPMTHPTPLGLKPDADLHVLWSGPTRNVEIGGAASNTVEATVTFVIPGRYVIGCFVECTSADHLHEITMDEDGEEGEEEENAAEEALRANGKAVFSANPLVVEVSA